MKLLKILLLFVVFLQVSVFAQTNADFKKILDEHTERYPEMEIQDYYKLIYQAALGNEHLFHDTASVHAYLLKEFATVPGSDSEILVENITPDSSIFRVHLRAFKHQGGDPDRLFKTMLASAHTFKKSEKRFKRFLRYFEKSYSRSLKKELQSDLPSFMKMMRKNKFPAVHHSAHFRERYHPAYRIIIKEQLPHILKK